MTEIHELGDDRGKPAEQPLTPGQVSLYLKAHNAARPCEACGAVGSHNWQMHEEASNGATAVMLVQFASPGGPSGAKPVVTLTCRGCGALRLFVRSRVAQWVAGAKA